MKTIEEMIAVMTAHVEGKKIEISRKGVAWEEVEKPAWDWLHYDYRVKPEPKKPTYRPYKDAEECFRDAQKHGGWVKGITLGCDGYYQIQSIQNDSIETCPMNPSYRYMLEMFTWADDGSPCGVLEEE